MMRTSLRALAVAALLVASARTATADAPATPVFSVVSEGGPLGNAFAVSPDGSKLAYTQLTQAPDGSVLSTVKVIALPAGAPLGTLPARPVTIDALAWATPDRLLVTERSGDGLVAHLATLAGGLGHASVGPADHITLSEVEGTPAVITTRATHAGAATEHAAAAFAVDDLHALRDGKVEERDGSIDRPDAAVSPLWWTGAFRTVVGRRPGRYDAKQDIRLPEQLVQVDVLLGHDASEPVPYVGFSRLTEESRLRPGASVFLFRDRAQFRLARGTRTFRMALRKPTSAYDVGSSHAQIIDGGEVLCSVTSTLRKGAPDLIEVYRVDTTTGAVQEVLAADGQRRFVRWHAARKRIAMLHKLRKDDPGGPTLDVYDLPAVGAPRP
ncbi:MAG: hypothetical protein ABI321_09890 [Polyangia bacterium]